MPDAVFHPEVIFTLLASVQGEHAPEAGHAAVAAPWWTPAIIWLPAGAALLCGLCAATRVRNKLPAWITSAFLGLSFVLTLLLYLDHEPGAASIVHIFDWFDIHWGEGENAGSFVANFSLYIDSLTLLWMLFVTGLGTLIAIYASEYMEADTSNAGYARFFGGVSIFLFAMSCLVMADNLVLLYLGWEGVGLASYLLIGYYYEKPSAVAAAKKAFIVNRIGDLGLALAIWFIWQNFGTVRYEELFPRLAAGEYESVLAGWSVQAVPFLLMLGAFGKSAQLPLYVWLPDAMEGPTPVSALIHAATMVTAGVYLLCRMVPMMEIAPAALPTVAWIGTATALLAATIGMAQFDFKRIWAYSTVSQLGYMFAGVGVLTTVGAAYHVFTHAFFKAVLFLTAGAVMHGFAGQLDLRKVSGLSKMKGWKITAFTMLVGCLALAGIPGLSGYFSKDMILAEAFVSGNAAVGWILLVTAGLTAYYTFRVWFRVCTGPVEYEMGDDHHGAEHEEPGDGHGHGDGHPHSPRLAINAVLVIITIGALLAAIPYFTGWVEHLIADSTATVAHDAGASHGEQAGHDAAHGTILGFDPHKAMYYISAVFGLVGLAIAAWLHWLNRPAADRLRGALRANPAVRWLPVAMENKWYVDEIYNALVRAPLWALGYVFFLFDKIIIDTLIVDGLGSVPRWLGAVFRPLQSGVLHDYAKTMVGAAALVILFVWLLKSGWLNWLTPEAATAAAGVLGWGGIPF